MNQLGSRVLTTQRLRLRPFCATDAEQAFSGWMSDPVVTKYLTWERHESIFFTRQLLAAWEQEAKLLTSYRWAIVWRETGVVIGDISVPIADMRSQWAEVGYCLSRAYWGKGIMTEALSAVIDFLIGKVGFLRIEAKHATENIASGRVMENAACSLKGCCARDTVFSPRANLWTLPSAPSCVRSGKQESRCNSCARKAQCLLL